MKFGNYPDGVWIIGTELGLIGLELGFTPLSVLSRLLSRFTSLPLIDETCLTNLARELPLRFCV
jgi:hypothetical protein